MDTQKQLGLFGELPSPKNERRQLRSPNGFGRTNQSLVKGQAELLDEVSSLKQQVRELEETVAQLRDLLLRQKTIKESYDTKEVAQILGRKPFTVREWCRLQRVNATKAMCGRGCEEEWRISHDELQRIQNEGLLPVPERY